jgi:hypothetical protein
MYITHTAMPLMTNFYVQLKSSRVYNSKMLPTKEACFEFSFAYWQIAKKSKAIRLRNANKLDSSVSTCSY